MKKAMYCALIGTAIGFAVAVWVFTASPESAPRWMSTTIAPYILCPPVMLAGLSMSDPNPESIWLFFAPLNAVIYGAMGFSVWLFFTGVDECFARFKKDNSDRPRDL